MMDARKMVLRFLVVYQGIHLVRSIQDADAVSKPAKLCLPYVKSELERYLKEHDTPDVSMSKSVPSLSVKDTESLPFGVLSVDWRRLRLLSDFSTLPKPGIDKVSSDKDFTEEVKVEKEEEEEAFLTTGNIRVPVPDERRGTTAHVRLHRSTLNNRNGNIDSTLMTVEPDTSDTWEEVTDSQTGIDIEENSAFTTEIPMLEDVEKSTEMITNDYNSNPTTTMLTTTFENTDSLIEEIATTEEIRQTISVSSQNYEDESTHRQESSSEAFPSTTGVEKSTYRQNTSSEVFPSTTEEEKSPHRQNTSSEVFPSTTEEQDSTHLQNTSSEVFPSTTEEAEESPHRQNTSSEVFPSTTEEADMRTTKMTVILKIGEPFSSVPKFVEHYGDREGNENGVSRVRSFGKSWDRHSQNRIDSEEDEALAKTRQSVFEPFDLGKKLRTRRPNSRRGKDGLVKRGGDNTNTEKLFRWFYRGDRKDNLGKTDAEIKCTERS